MATYPQREQFFAYKFVRLLTKTAAAQDLGPQVCWLLSVIAHQEDAKRYRGAVTYYNNQLLPLVGCNSHDALDRVRKKAIDSGWLHYKSGRKGKAGQYWVIVPREYLDADDGPCDETDPFAAFSEPQPTATTDVDANRTHICEHNPEESRAQPGGKPSATRAQPERKCVPFYPYPNPYPPPPPVAPESSHGDAAWKSLVQAAVAAGLEVLDCLKAAYNAGLAIAEIREIIQHFEDQRELQGWTPAALHHRLNHAEPGQPVDRGWPPPDPKAIRRQQAAQREAQQAMAAQGKERDREQSRERLEAIEAEFGPELDSMNQGDLLELAASVSPFVAKRVRQAGLVPSVRSQLLMAMSARGQPVGGVP